VALASRLTPSCGSFLSSRTLPLIGHSDLLQVDVVFMHAASSYVPRVVMVTASLTLGPFATAAPVPRRPGARVDLPYGDQPPMNYCTRSASLLTVNPSFITYISWHGDKKTADVSSRQVPSPPGGD